MIPGNPQRVIVMAREFEIYGYAVASGEGRVVVVWEAASGRRHRRTFPAAEVFLPGEALPWAGIPIDPDQLAGPVRVRH